MNFNFASFYKFLLYSSYLMPLVKWNLWWSLSNGIWFVFWTRTWRATGTGNRIWVVLERVRLATWIWNWARILSQKRIPVFFVIPIRNIIWHSHCHCSLFLWLRNNKTSTKTKENSFLKTYIKIFKENIIKKIQKIIIR